MVVAFNQPLSKSTREAELRKQIEVQAEHMTR